jgi:hypothetical protein
MRYIPMKEVDDMIRERDEYVVLHAVNAKVKSMSFDWNGYFQYVSTYATLDPTDREFLNKPRNYESNGHSLLCFHFKKRNPLYGMVDTDTTDLWMIVDSELEKNDNVKFYIDGKGNVYRHDVDSNDIKMIESHMREDRANPRVKLLGKYFNIDTLIGNQGNMKEPGNGIKWEF